MLSATIVHVCARCGSEHIRKNALAELQAARCLDAEEPAARAKSNFHRRTPSGVRAASDTALICSSHRCLPPLAGGPSIREALSVMVAQDSIRSRAGGRQA